MKENSRLTMMSIIASLVIGGITSTVADAAANNNYQKFQKRKKQLGNRKMRFGE